ncbi:unnamed protein product [Nippostrongylus brasiliensis]|uniref:Secreted protein n=1 Tax=Nippostrongylus brasiliensis TaxID=27835 RepID=A0A0N4XVZ7_NIPBR|nr:hypothetical protein Q1695_011440 [Nippostrongylus brasiliensis]VDL70602.1 unnamed protein product [Nippostrongylus brasiliensis]
MRLLLVTLIVAAVAVNADWWDSLTETVSGGLLNAASWVKDTASPAIRDTFNGAKEKLQDPDTHRTIQKWLAERADQVKTFAENEVAPELKKIYNAAKEAASKSGSESDEKERSVEAPGK